MAKNQDHPQSISCRDRWLPRIDVCRTGLGAWAWALLPCAWSVTAQSTLQTQYNITEPLRICIASIDNSGLRCNGAPAEFRQAVQPAGPVPASGWCSPGEDFCGNDVDVWSEVADRLELKEGQDFERVCLGESGFSYMIDSLAESNLTYGRCDIGVSAITASSEREDRGIMFARPVHRSSLAILVHAPLKKRGSWAFFQPLHLNVWIALAATVVITPLIVFFFEAVFNKSPFYAKGGKLDIMRGLRECIWHSVCHTLSIDVFRVRSFPARIITVAYAFLVLILTHTYTANLAAFLTVQQLDTNIQTASDLHGKAVATVPTYVSRLAENHHISASTADGWDYVRMIDKLRAGEYAAVISDDTQLLPRAYVDGTCSLHILKETIEPFDLAFAFRRQFPSDALLQNVSSVLLEMQEDGTLGAIREEYTPDEPRCLTEATEFSETNQVEIQALWGLWIIMAGAAVASVAGGVAEWAIKRRQSHPDAAVIGDRIDRIAHVFTCGRIGAHGPTAAVEPAVMAAKPTPFNTGPGTEGNGADAAGYGDVPFRRPAAPAGMPPAARLSYLQHAAALRYSNASSIGRNRPAQDPLRHSSISVDSALPADAALPHNLSMHSMHSMGGGSILPPYTAHSAAPPSGSFFGSSHGGSREDVVLELPGLPQEVEGAAARVPQQPQRARHGGSGQAESNGQAVEFRDELGEVVSMLRMVTNRVNSLQGSQRVHV